jgi:chitodextrinase
MQIATAADPADADWKFATTSTRSSATVTGLTPGTRYWFRVAATAPAGQSPWSSPAPARSL